MKKPSVLQSFLLPILLLMLLPVLTGLGILQESYQNDVTQAFRRVHESQRQMEPIFTEAFGSAQDAGEDNAEEALERFLSLLEAREGDRHAPTHLMVLSADHSVLYSREKGPRQVPASFPELCLSAIEAGETSCLLKADHRYATVITPIPLQTEVPCYLVLFSSSSQPGEWVNSAVLHTMLVTLSLSLLAFVALLLGIRRITRSIRKLCTEVGRIGGGDFEPIESHFRTRELEELRLSMNGMAGQLSRSDEMRRQFYLGISHDLRNPLQSVIGYAQGIELGVFPAEDASRKILEEGRRIVNLVDNLCALTRPESSSEQVALGPLSALQAAQNCLERFHDQAEQRKLQLELLADGGEMPVLANRQLLVSVLDNLLSNAIRYAETKITLTLKETPDSVTFLVEDDGAGIAAEDLPHIFELYYMGPGGHSGLGLSVARSAAERMGGSLEYVETPGAGASFLLTLQKADTEAA